MELYAWCVNSHATGNTDGVHICHLYKVCRYVDDDKRFYPCGLRIEDYLGNELTETFYMQQFLYFEIYLS